MSVRRQVLVAVVAVLAVLAMRAAPAAAAPQLLSFGDAGLRLGDASIYGKKVDGAAYDAAQDLVWFTSARTLYVIDLRDPARKPVAIASKMPENGFAVTGWSKAAWSTTYAGLYPALALGRSAKITVEAGAYGGIWEDQDADNTKRIKKVKLVGKKWLDKQKKRKPRTLPEAPALGNWTGKLVPMPANWEGCDDGGGLECGDNVTFGNTGLWLVVMSSACGDACHASCVFYDPKTKKFADPTATKGAWTATISPDTGASCFPEDWGLHASGEYYSGSKRCTVGKEVVCTEAAGWTHVGWVE